MEKKVIEAAAICKDEILEAVDQYLCYHMDNQCYKHDTLKKALDTVKVDGSIMVLCIGNLGRFFIKLNVSHYINVKWKEL